MKSVWKAPLAAITALALCLVSAPAALAHGSAHGTGGRAGTEGPLGVLLLPPEYVLGAVAFFGVLHAVKRRMG